jgi:hypothetical protein
VGTPVDGEVVDAEAYAENEGYMDQVIFVNRATSALVDDILAQPDVSPHLRHSSRHGNWPSESVARTWGPEELNREIIPIFNAYYLPGGGASRLYPSITPVNSSRVILDYYFDTNLGLLEDKACYNSDYYDAPYDLVEITDQRGKRHVP